MKITAQTETITLDDIARDPLRVNALSADATRQLIAMLEMARGALKGEAHCPVRSAGGASRRARRT